MNRKKKSGFITFCCSLLPGAGEMYLGFMKMGFSLLAVFVLIITLGNFLNIGLISNIGIVLWFYSFFHVHNLAGLSDEEFARTKDEFLFNLDDLFNTDKSNIEKYRKVIATVLIIIGTLLLWKGIKSAFLPLLPDYFLRIVSRMENTLPQIVVGIGIIIGGFYMIKGKKEELKEVIIDVTDKTSGEENNEAQNQREEVEVYGTEKDM